LGQKALRKRGFFGCRSVRGRPKSAKFPVFSLMIREFDAETGSLQTGSSATQSGLFTYNLEIAANLRGARRFCARREPEKAISLLISRIPLVFSPREEKTGRFRVPSRPTSGLRLLKTRPAT
jgi:hypothetical protein